MIVRVDDLLAAKSVCPRCGNHGAQAERLAIAGTGLSRLLEIQAHRCSFVSCTNCGDAEVFNRRMWEGKDNLGPFLESLFSD